MMPKSMGNAYFIACQKGAKKPPRSWASSCSGTARPIPIRRSKARLSTPGLRAAST